MKTFKDMISLLTVKKYKCGRILLLIICVLAFARTAGAEPGRDGWPLHLRVLLGPEGGQWFQMNEALTKTLTRYVLPTTCRSGGGLGNIEKLNMRGADIAFSLTSFLGGAGSDEDSVVNTENVAVLGNIYPQVMYFLVRREFLEQNNLKSVEDLLNLRDLRFASLKKGTASEFMLRSLFKYGYNTSFEQLKNDMGWVISFNNYAETADNFAVGNLDCFAYTAGMEVPLLLNLENYTKFTVLPISETVLNKMKTQVKTTIYTINSGIYEGVTSPVKTLGDYTCLIVRRDLPDDLVYTIAKALWDDRKALTDAMSDYGQISPSTVIPDNVITHPGALKFWQELQQSSIDVKTKE